MLYTVEKMNFKEDFKRIFSHPVLGILPALLSCAFLGSLYPMVKIGYAAFCIGGGDVASILLFAGLRFLICGLITVPLFALASKRPLLTDRSDWKMVLGVALFSIILHYACTYWALAIGQSAKSAIVKQVGFLFLSCFSFLFIKSDRFTLKKAFCGALGFAGIIITNFEGRFTFAAGDALILSASFCSVVSTILTKKAVVRVSPVKLVAASQLIGGVVLCVIGLLFGGRITHLDLRAVLVMLYICAASIFGYVLWNVVIQYHSVSKLSVIRFSIPLFSVVFSGILLHEEVWRWNYILALGIIFAAILLNVISPKNKKNNKMEIEK